jgi:hypothetical protein
LITRLMFFMRRSESSKRVSESSARATTLALDSDPAHHIKANWVELDGQMGGIAPIGYDVVDKKLIINQLEAETVRHIFERYLALRCVRRLKGELDNEGFISKVRANGTGGKPFSRGALYTLLKNCTYIGKVGHNGKVFDGEHQRIIDQEVWNQIEARLTTNRSRARRRSKAKAPSLLAGLLYDSRGNPMSPTHATKGEKRYRYYISQAVLKFEKHKEGDVLRVPAESVELVCTAQLKSFLNKAGSLLKSLSHLGLAAPDIMEAIIKGKIPADLTLDRLKNRFPWTGANKDGHSDSQFISGSHQSHLCFPKKCGSKLGQTGSSKVTVQRN